jgi:hypothetical protein
MPQASALPNTLGEVVQRCQALLGDKTGYLVSRAYAVPFINQAYEDIASQIKNASGKNLEAVIECLNIATGTQSLYSLQADGDLTAVPPVQPGPLRGLFDPIRMWAKSAGQLPQYYTPARGPRDTLPHINSPGITPGTYATQITFVWIGNQLSITPVAGPIDIQVYGRFNPPRLVSDSDKLVIYGNMTAMLAYSATALMGVERTNPQILAGYIERATAMIDNAVADIIRQCQRNPRRLAKMGGQGGCCWGWGSGVW